jgi:hypothetical protein
MQTNLMTIGGVDLKPSEVFMLAGMLARPDHTHAPEKEPDEDERAALDMLVLEGIIERFRTPAGEWLDAWVITDEAIGWVQEPEVNADIQLAKRLFKDCLNS